MLSLMPKLFSANRFTFWASLATYVAFFITRMLAIMRNLSNLYLFIAIISLDILFVNFIREFSSIISSPLFSFFSICADLTYTWPFTFWKTIMGFLANMDGVKFVMFKLTMILTFFFRVGIIWTKETLLLANPNLTLMDWVLYSCILFTHIRTKLALF